MKQQIKQVLLVALAASLGARADVSNSDLDALRATPATIEDEDEFILSIEPDGADLSIVTDAESDVVCLVDGIVSTDGGTAPVGAAIAMAPTDYAIVPLQLAKLLKDAKYKRQAIAYLRVECTNFPTEIVELVVEETHGQRRLRRPVESFAITRVRSGTTAEVADEGADPAPASGVSR